MAKSDYQNGEVKKSPSARRAVNYEWEQPSENDLRPFFSIYFGAGNFLAIW